MHQKIKRSYFSLNFSLAFFPVIILFSVISFYVYNSEKNADLRIIEAKETEQLNSQLAIISEDFQYVSDDLLMISKLSELQKLVEGNSWDKRGLENDLSVVSLAKKRYDQIRYLDATGMEVVRINYNKGRPLLAPAEKLQNKAQRYYFTDTIKLNRDEIFISPMDLNIEHGQIEQPLKPMVRFGTPIFDPNGEKRGVLLINYLANGLLEKIQSYCSDDHCHFSFLNSEGYWLAGEEPADQWGFMYGERKELTFGNKHPLEWQKILASDSGQFTSDKGMFTYATIFPLSENHLSSDGSGHAYEQSTEELTGRQYFFKIVKHVPDSVLEQHAGKLFMRFLPLYLITGLIVLVGSWCFAIYRKRGYMARLEKDNLIDVLKSSLDEISTLRGIIPICSSCKNIRDDKGAWNQIEAYISEHTEAEFSHGMCNDCLKKMYPDFADEIIKEIETPTK